MEIEERIDVVSKSGVYSIDRSFDSYKFEWVLDEYGFNILVSKYSISGWFGEDEIHIEFEMEDTETFRIERFYKEIENRLKRIHTKGELVKLIKWVGEEVLNMAINYSTNIKEVIF